MGYFYFFIFMVIKYNEYVFWNYLFVKCLKYWEVMGLRGDLVDFK